LIGSGSNPLIGSSKYRSIRITGRMITVADSDLHATDFDPRPARSPGRKLMTVPISLSPRLFHGRMPYLGSCPI
jgi:hypothetical protein